MKEEYIMVNDKVERKISAEEIQLEIDKFTKKYKNDGLEIQKIDRITEHNIVVIQLRLSEWAKGQSNYHLMWIQNNELKVRTWLSHHYLDEKIKEIIEEKK